MIARKVQTLLQATEQCTIQNIGEDCMTASTFWAYRIAGRKKMQSSNIGSLPRCDFCRLPTAATGLWQVRHTYLLTCTCLCVRMYVHSMSRVAWQPTEEAVGKFPLVGLIVFNEVCDEQMCRLHVLVWSNVCFMTFCVCDILC